MGNIYSSFKTYNFKEIQKKIKSTGTTEIILINTLPDNEQNYLIYGTITANRENDHINGLLKKNKNQEIIIYGRNYTDMSVVHKYNSLKKLGFNNVYIYFGGIFEWALLQDIYGTNNFLTIGTINDPIIFSG
jgi:hypothetical protein